MINFEHIESMLTHKLYFVNFEMGSKQIASGEPTFADILDYRPDPRVLGDWMYADSEQAAQNLKVVRTYAKLTSKELADLSGVNHSRLRAIEACRRFLETEDAFRIAQATGADPCSLTVGNTPLEWGGGSPFNSEVYRAWVERGRVPSESQEVTMKRKFENLCHRLLEVGKKANGLDAVLASHVAMLLAGVDHHLGGSGNKRKEPDAEKVEITAPGA